MQLSSSILSFFQVFNIKEILEDAEKKYHININNFYLSSPVSRSSLVALEFLFRFPGDKYIIYSFNILNHN